jgi:uncharacterized phosphosugar-binding protein
VSQENRKRIARRSPAGPPMVAPVTSHAPNRADEFLGYLRSLLTGVQTTQAQPIEQAAELWATAIAAGGLVHVFGSGHSSLPCADVYGRAGGLVPINWIVSEELLPLWGMRSAAVERLSGFAAVLLNAEPLRAGDVLVVVSNSGRNAVPVEMVEAGRARGLHTVAITSLNHARSVASRAPSGRLVCDVADIVIDTLVPAGDAGLRVGEGSEITRVGAASTIVAAAILQAISAETAERLAIRGMHAPVFVSANVDGNEEHNDAELRRMRVRAPTLLAADINRLAGG